MKSHIEIVEYDKSYANLEHMKKLFFMNYSDHMNLNKFRGIYLSMKAKYGKLAYVLLATPGILTFVILSCLMAMISQYTKENVTLLCAAASTLVNYWLFAVFFVKRMYKCHIDYGHYMLSNFHDIDEKYMKKGGKFWLAIVDNPATSKKEIVGHLGFLKVETEELLDDGYEVPAKVGHLEAIGVNSQFRGLGIGKRLLEKAISYGEEQNFDRLNLDVYAINTNSVDLYKKYGFKVTKIFEIDSITGLTHQIMVKILKNK